MSSTQFPLREKRKAATRSSLIRSAQTLFAAQGYDATTLEEIAGHAGLHVQTLYRHFASKQELATAGDEDLLELFRQAITHPQRNTDTFTFWREWVRSATEKVTQEDGGQGYRAFLLQRWTQPLVSSRLIRIANQYEDLLTESLAKDFGMPAAGVSTPRLVATMLWGINAYVQRMHATQEEFDLVREIIGAIDAVEAQFGHLVRN